MFFLLKIDTIKDGVQQESQNRSTDIRQRSSPVRSEDQSLAYVVVGGSGGVNISQVIKSLTHRLSQSNMSRSQRVTENSRMCKNVVIGFFDFFFGIYAAIARQEAFGDPGDGRTEVRKSRDVSWRWQRSGGGALLHTHSHSVGVAEDLSRQSSDWRADEGGGEGEILLNGGLFGRRWTTLETRSDSFSQIFWP